MVQHAPNPVRLSGRLTRSQFRGKIGIMGGSFNPPHAGHLAMAKRARAQAGLKYVIWLVSPQNPLKSSQGMASFTSRFAACEDMAKGHSWLHVSKFETCLQQQTGQNYQPVTTAQTLVELRRLLPYAQLVWVMGADNLIQFGSWDNCEVIQNATDMLILGRPGYNYQALSGYGRHLMGLRTQPRQLGKKTSSGTNTASRWPHSKWPHSKWPHSKWVGGKWAFDMNAYNLLSATQLRQAGNQL